MKRVLIVVLALSLIAVSAVQAQSLRYRIGAICNDGWVSKAVSVGACSYHGGVRCWQYSDGTCTNP